MGETGAAIRSASSRPAPTRTSRSAAPALSRTCFATGRLTVPPTVLPMTSHHKQVHGSQMISPGLRPDFPFPASPSKMENMENVISCNPNILGGTPVFAGSRVPVESLFDYLKRGHSIEYFLEQFPTVKREQVERLIDEAEAKVLPRHVSP